MCEVDGACEACWHRERLASRLRERPASLVVQRMDPAKNDEWIISLPVLHAKVFAGLKHRALRLGLLVELSAANQIASGNSLPKGAIRMAELLTGSVSQDLGYWAHQIAWLFIGLVFSEVVSAYRRHWLRAKSRYGKAGYGIWDDELFDSRFEEGNVPLIHPREDPRAFLYSYLFTTLVYSLLVALPDFFSPELVVPLRAVALMLVLAVLACAVFAFASVGRAKRIGRTAAFAVAGIVYALCILLVSLFGLGIFAELCGASKREVLVFGSGGFFALGTMVACFISLFVWRHNRRKGQDEYVEAIANAFGESAFDPQDLRDAYDETVGYGTLINILSFSESWQRFKLAGTSSMRGTCGNGGECSGRAVAYLCAVLAVAIPIAVFAACEVTMCDGPAFVRLEMLDTSGSTQSRVQVNGYNAFLQVCESTSYEQSGELHSFARFRNDVFGMRSQSIYDSSETEYIVFLRTAQLDGTPCDEDVNRCLSLMAEREGIASGVMDNRGDMLRRYHYETKDGVDYLIGESFEPGEHGRRVAYVYYTADSEHTPVTAYEPSFDEGGNFKEWVALSDPSKYTLRTAA